MVGNNDKGFIGAIDVEIEVHHDTIAKCQDVLFSIRNFQIYLKVKIVPPMLKAHIPEKSFLIM
jgi:hypothetical protein